MFGRGFDARQLQARYEPTSTWFVLDNSENWLKGSGNRNRNKIIVGKAATVKELTFLKNYYIIYIENLKER